MFLDRRGFLVFCVWLPQVARGQVLKYPGDECSIELRDNNLCLRETGCVKTGVHDNGEDKRQCMCSQGRILDPQLYCSDCVPGDPNKECGEHSTCSEVEGMSGVFRCHCDPTYVRNITTNDGSCVKCKNGVSGFESLCDKGACVDNECVCGVGYLLDPVNNTCIHCDQPWHPTVMCNVTYPNTTCFKDKLVNDYTCMCPLGEAFDQERQCGECDETQAPCRPGWQCIQGAHHLEPSMTEKWCYETCDPEEAAACDPRATQKTCTVPQLNLLGDESSVCRCQVGYVQQDDGTCVSALEQLNCFTCNATTPCNSRQSETANFYATCEVGEYCWTTANWYWNFDTREYENITYRRQCHSNPCKNADEDFCTDDPYHAGHHVCVSCCTTGVCNKKQLTPNPGAAQSTLHSHPSLSRLLLHATHLLMLRIMLTFYQQ